jgi:probable HAF family extracellular repeat protein
MNWHYQFALRHIRFIEPLTNIDCPDKSGRRGLPRSKLLAGPASLSALGFRAGDGHFHCNADQKDRHDMKRSRIPIASASALSLAVMMSAVFSEVANATQSQFIGLGDLPGGISLSTASDVSADGSVVVGASSHRTSSFNCCRGGRSTITLRNAFRWTEQDGMVALGTLSEAISANSFATAISADGSTVVGNSGVFTISPARPPILPQRPVLTNDAFRWRSGPGMVGLGTATVTASDVSADGRVVVGSGSFDGANEAFRWRQASGITPLGDLPGGAFASSATGISADGRVIVGSGTTDSGSEAFRWTKESGMVGLGDLPGGTFTSSVANDVSADGSVVVGYGATADSNEAFRWTENAGMVGLGDLPGGLLLSIANDVSADGSVVVGYSNTDAGDEAFVWDATHGMRNLRDLFVNQHGLGDSLAGWTLTSATGVSADGQVIVGTGRNPDGVTEAWRVRLGSEPALPGDFNGNGTVDAADYVVWRKGLGTTYTAAAYDDWRAKFGQTIASGTALSFARSLTAAVPEPSALRITAIAALALATRYRRQHIRMNR